MTREKAISLLEQLENNPLVDSVCSVPLNCTIVCHLWRTLEEALPTTMTDALHETSFLMLFFVTYKRLDAHSNILITLS